MEKTKIYKLTYSPIIGARVKSEKNFSVKKGDETIMNLVRKIKESIKPRKTNINYYKIRRNGIERIIHVEIKTNNKLITGIIKYDTYENYLKPYPYDNIKVILNLNSKNPKYEEEYFKLKKLIQKWQRSYW